MSSQDSWSCLSVQKFFSLCNWQGQGAEGQRGRGAEGHFKGGSAPGEINHLNIRSPQLPSSSAPLLLGQTSWQCLSVENFFSLCNWQGQPLENHNWQHQDQLLELTLQAEAAIASHQNSWQCLSVKEFFSLCNWQGQPLENRHSHHADPSSRLKERVREFFQFIPWEGNPEIGSLPKVSFIPEPTPSAFVETTLTDLSDLF